MQQISELIAHHGWIIQGVGPGGRSPHYQYTVGLWPATGFELIAAGLPPEAGQTILNLLARRVLDGQRFINGDVLTGVLAGLPATMIEIPVSGNYLGVANRLYRLRKGENIPAWQLVYPDPEGLWPWDLNSKVREEPVLGNPPAMERKMPAGE